VKDPIYPKDIPNPGKFKPNYITLPKCNIGQRLKLEHSGGKINNLSKV
jgi:hypothetical protein